MERFEKVWELLKEWYELGLITETKDELSLTISISGTEYCVAIVELGAEEYGATIEECLDAHIRELQHDYDYRKAKFEHEQREKGIQELKVAGWL
ncbi:hypothetical protein [Cetobacterium sp.]|uniref:hypothetical protein n=1 Tax=Cetobacterium sp. TaxID=2071632 RepID=UPI003F3CCE96